jgi:NitT/TauT family transport system substrate-binding protein
LKGKVDISAGSYVAYIAAEAAGARFRILTQASILAPNTRSLVVTAQSRVTTIAALAGQKIGVNRVNSIGTLLVSALLSAHGISPARVRFVADPGGFPALPGNLQRGDWAAAFLAEPYITAAGQQYGDEVLADLDQGAVTNLPVDGYVSTLAWARQHPKTAAAFTRAIEQGQKIANRDVSAVRAIMAQNDKLPPQVTASMALPATYPVGPVVAAKYPARRGRHAPVRCAQPAVRHPGQARNRGQVDDRPRLTCAAPAGRQCHVLGHLRARCKCNCIKSNRTGNNGARTPFRDIFASSSQASIRPVPRLPRCGRADR